MPQLIEVEVPDFLAKPQVAVFQWTDSRCCSASNNWKCHRDTSDCLQDRSRQHASSENADHRSAGSPGHDCILQEDNSAGSRRPSAGNDWSGYDAQDLETGSGHVSRAFCRSSTRRQFCQQEPHFAPLPVPRSRKWLKLWWRCPWSCHETVPSSMLRGWSRSRCPISRPRPLLATISAQVLVPVPLLKRWLK